MFEVGDNIIKLTLNQLIYVGMHIGHTIRNTNFFSAWMIYGYRKKLVIFDLVLSLFLLKNGLFILKKSIKMHCPILFVNYNIFFSTIVSRYAYICGEMFSSYKWINGGLTNFKKVIKYNNFIYSLIVKDKFYFRNFDKLNFSKFYGFIFNKRRLPFLVFVTSIKKAYNVIDEAYNLLIPSIAIVDSDSFAFNIFLPVPGNDTSYKCVNFYNYFFSKSIMNQKIMNFRKFEKIKKTNFEKKNNIILFWLLYNNVSRNKIYKIEKKKKSKNLNHKFYANFLDRDIIVTWNNNKLFPNIKNV